MLNIIGIIFWQSLDNFFFRIYVFFAIKGCSDQDFAGLFDPNASRIFCEGSKWSVLGHSSMESTKNKF